jgi:hypothetical protein
MIFHFSVAAFVAGRILLSLSLSEWPYGSYREKRLSPRQAPGRSLLRSLLAPSPKRTQVRLKSLLYIVWLTPDPL